MAMLNSCNRTQTDSKPLTQWAYVWQRDWTPSVTTALATAAQKLDGFVVLGAEIIWKDGAPQVLRPRVDWTALHTTGKPVGIAMRINPFPHSPALLRERTRLFAETAGAVVADARAHGTECAEFQLDYDSPENRLSDYRSWLGTVRDAVRPVRFVITTLPSWLDASEFATLVSIPDAFVLQVHSIPPRSAEDRVALCDTANALRWAAKAAQFSRDFSVALPTYSALVGFDPNGHSIGMAADGVQPSWPPGTRVVEFDSDAEIMAALASQWRESHPSTMRRIAWYRLPVDGKRNWRWPTFSAVLEGRPPQHKLEALIIGENPADLSLANLGEAEERMTGTLIVEWNGPAPVDAEALPGWVLETSAHGARFTRDQGPMPRLLPGMQRAVGWLRFSAEPQARPVLRAEFVR